MAEKYRCKVCGRLVQDSMIGFCCPNPECVVMNSKEMFEEVKEEDGVLQS